MISSSRSATPATNSGKRVFTSDNGNVFAIAYLLTKHEHNYGRQNIVGLGACHRQKNKSAAL